MPLEPTVHAKAHALTLFRVLPNGEARSYTATTFPRNPWQGCERTIRMGWKFGWLVSSHENGYAVLDVLDEDGDIVQDWTVTSSRAFQKLKRRLDIVVEHETSDDDNMPADVDTSLEGTAAQGSDGAANARSRQA